MARACAEATSPSENAARPYCANALKVGMHALVNRDQGSRRFTGRHLICGRQLVQSKRQDGGSYT